MVGVLCNTVAADEDLQKQLISIKKQYGTVSKDDLFQSLQVPDTKEELIKYLFQSVLMIIIFSYLCSMEEFDINSVNKINEARNDNDL